MEKEAETEEIIQEQVLPKASSQKMLFLGILIGVLFCLLLALAFYFYINSKSNIASESLILAKKEPTPTEQTVSPAPTLLWLEKQTEISLIPVFKQKKDLSDTLSMYLTEEAKFWRVAQFPDGATLINATLPIEGPSEPVMVRFIETKDKRYSCLTNYLDEWLGKNIKNLLSPGTLLEEQEIAGLDSPDVIDSGDNKFLKVRVLQQNFNDLKSPELVAETPYGAIYKYSINKVMGSEEIYARSLYLKLKDNTLVSYKLKVDFYSDNGVPEIFFNVNPDQKNMENFTQRLAGGCGLLMIDSVPIIKDNSPLIAAKKEIGRTVNGEPIYQVVEPTSDLVEIFYKNYRGGRDYQGAPPTEPIEQMARTVNHFLWEDTLGDWQLFQNSHYEMMAECGKPVIYLYPTEKTEVMVKVGAAITKSDPPYSENGWQVMAYPEGRLIYKGENYDSLFWEGLGEGFYPNLKEDGFVVPQKDLLPTVKKHLELLGLNEKETADFLAFWTDKFPQTPFVRLTWLGTREMDILAPLEVKPEPETKIRIFLDFEGLDQLVALKPQKLSSVKRQGFTLVEWGGLLTDEKKN